MNIDKKFWQGKRVALTGHTGFKGSWLSIWLSELGAEVFGYALAAPTDPSLFELANLESKIDSTIGDVRDLEQFKKFMDHAQPEIVFHLAAQPLVISSYADPIETFSTNVMGTANVLEAIRSSPSVKAVVVVTTDKCYQNNEWLWGYRESDRLGGKDPYANSKACAELVAQSYRDSFFQEGPYLATARAGNVIGGGDWAEYRLVPDCLQAFLAAETITIRSPLAIRPWQHVLESLNGYLLLGQNLFEKGAKFAQSWNFGPDSKDECSVEFVVKSLCKKWPEHTEYMIENSDQVHEATFLKLDSSKARNGLQWQPKWSIDQALDKVIEWTVAYSQKEDLLATCIAQINAYSQDHE